MEADRRDLSGAELVAAVTHLLQRTRLEDPTYGVWESSDPQWWWRRPRKTDTWAMPVWFDAEGPVGAVMATDWDDAIAIDCFVLPGRSDLVDHVCDVGLGAIDAHPETRSDYPSWRSTTATASHRERSCGTDRRTTSSLRTVTKSKRDCSRPRCTARTSISWSSRTLARWLAMPCSGWIR